MDDTSDAIDGFHAHVYFDHDSVERARGLCERARDRFGIGMGRMHQKPVGPHPMWSCQLSVPTERFGEVIPWLALNRGGLNVLVHPQTGDSLRDHVDHAMWLGDSQRLNVDMFRHKEQS